MSWLSRWLADFSEFKFIARLIQRLGDATMDDIERTPPIYFIGPGYLWYLSQHHHHDHGGDIGADYGDFGEGL